MLISICVYTRTRVVHQMSREFWGRGEGAMGVGCSVGLVVRDSEEEVVVMR